MTIPKLRQEEAKICCMLILLGEKNFSLTSTELKSRIYKVRHFGNDAAKANIRDAEPIYAAIVQNCIDRMDENDEIFRAKFIERETSVRPQIVRLTEEGILFSKKMNTFLNKQIERGFQLHNFFYRDFLSKFNEQISRSGLNISQFEKSIKSKAYSEYFYPEKEKSNFFQNAAAKISQIISEADKGDDTAIDSINMWISGREDFDFFDFKLSLD